MAPEFLGDWLGSTATADRVVRWGLFLLLLLMPLGVRWLARMVLKPAQRLVQRIAGEELGERIIQTLYPPAQFLLIILAFYAGLNALDFNLSPQIENLLERSTTILILVGIFWGAYRTIDVIAEFFKRRSQHRPDTLLDVQTIRVANQIGEVVIVLLGFVVIMDELGYNINGLVAGLGLTGLAVALAAQAALANWIGYFSIITDTPFEIGDFIVFGDISGTVEAVGFRSTRLRQPDQSLAIIPNKVLADAAIINWSRLRKRRLDMVLGLAYTTPPDKIRAVVEAIHAFLQNDERVIHDGSELTQFVEFGESSLNLRVIAHLPTPDWGEFQAQREAINLHIMDLLAQHGVERALPTRFYVEPRQP